MVEWNPPLFHEDLSQPPVSTDNTGDTSCQQLPTTRSGRTVKSVDYYGY